VFTLFKSFITQQTTLIKNSVVKEMVKGNVKPLLFLTTIFPILGEVSRTSKAGITGNKEELDKSLIMKIIKGDDIKAKEALLRYVDDLASIGAAGLTYDLFKTMARDPKALANWAFVSPSLSDISDFGYSSAKAVKGDLKPIARFTVGQTPIPVFQQRMKSKLKEKEVGSPKKIKYYNSNAEPDINIDIDFDYGIK
jgi:hypothetical protein